MLLPGGMKLQSYCLSADLSPTLHGLLPDKQGCHVLGLRELLLNTVPNFEQTLEDKWMRRLREADPTAELEIQTAVAAKDPNFTVRCNPSPLYEMMMLLCLHSVLVVMLLLLLETVRHQASPGCAQPSRHGRCWRGSCVD